MVTRKVLKERAKSTLKTNYGKSVGSFSIAAIIVLTVFGLSLGMSVAPVFISIMSNILVSHLLTIFLVSFVLMAGVAVIISASFATGISKYHLNLSENGKASIGDIFWGYRTNPDHTIMATVKFCLIVLAYAIIPIATIVYIGITANSLIIGNLSVTLATKGKILVTLATVPLYVLIGSIPGIIKSYHYSMMYFILAEDPDISSREVLKKSKALMQGHHMELFKLQLSFIGWELIGILVLGIGILFIMPYVNATVTEFYKELISEE
ncbi:MAG: DUF975 family protein [Clostridia bacterium]|nr:DUF975 family protein [Clostridia bacterium]